jgi:hypothetical protein
MASQDESQNPTSSSQDDEDAQAEVSLYLSNDGPYLCIKYDQKEHATDHIRAMNRRPIKTIRKDDTTVVIKLGRVQVKTENNGQAFRVVCSSAIEAIYLMANIHLPNFRRDGVSLVVEPRLLRNHFIAFNEDTGPSLGSGMGTRFGNGAR